MPELGDATKTEVNFSSDVRCATALDPGTARRAWTAGEPTVPGQLHVVVLPPGDQRRIGLRGQVLDIDPRFGGEVLGQQLETGFQDGYVLVGNAADVQGRFHVLAATGGQEKHG